MGFYWWSALYFGRLTSSASHTRLLESQLVKDNPGILDRFLESDPVNYPTPMFILHLPGHFQKVGWVDPVLEEHELMPGGKVQWGDVACIAYKWAENVDDADLETLKQLIRAAAPPAHEADKLRAGWYIFQGQWSSLGGLEDMHMWAEANVPVVGCPFETYAKV